MWKNISINSIRSHTTIIGGIVAGGFFFPFFPIIVRLKWNSPLNAGKRQCALSLSFSLAWRSEEAAILSSYSHLWETRNRILYIRWWRVSLSEGLLFPETWLSRNLSGCSSCADRRGWILSYILFKEHTPNRAFEPRLRWTRQTSILLRYIWHTGRK